MIGYFRRNHFVPVRGTIIETGTDSYCLASTRAQAERAAD